MNEADVLAGGAAGLAGFFAFSQAAITSAPQFGWLARPWFVRIPMATVGVLMLSRCYTAVALHQPFNPSGRYVVFTLAFLFGVMLLDVISDSWRGREAEAARLAAEPKRAAFRLVFQRLRRLEPTLRETQAAASANASELDRIRKETAWLRMEPPAYTEITRPPPAPSDD